MIALWKNPELIRNARAQLRPRRLITVALICAVLSLAVGFSFAHASNYPPTSAPPGQWGTALLSIAFGAQAMALLLAGGIACLHSVQREKEQNTFDFQRVTQLSPLELAVGKLFGAPALAYFIALCFLPAAIYGAVVAGIDARDIFVAYVILLLGSFALHGLALLISVLIPANSGTAGVLLYLAVTLVATLAGQDSPFDGLRVHSLSPIFPVWAWSASDSPADFLHLFSIKDIFFDNPIPHVIVLAILYVVFCGWFLLGVTRNIKRDPSAYALFSPLQSMILILYINFLLLGFWGPTPHSWAPRDITENVFLVYNAALFIVLGVALLRNREYMRRRLRERGMGTLKWLENLWPVPFVFPGIVIAGVAIVWFVQKAVYPDYAYNPDRDWSWRIGAIRVLFFFLWLARDLLFLQWMNLRRPKRPLMLGVLYLLVFYVSTGVIFRLLEYFDKHLAITAIFLPMGALTFTGRQWAASPQSWTVALAAYVIIAALFAYLQHDQARALAGAASQKGEHFADRSLGGK